MKNYLGKKKDDHDALKGILESFGPIIFFSALLFLIIIVKQEIMNRTASIIIIIILVSVFVILFIYLYRRQIKFDSTDKNIIIIIISFLKEINTTDSEVISKLTKIFAHYKEIYIREVCRKYFYITIDLDTACKKIAKKNTDARYFVIYILMDLSAKDRLLSIKEESFIKEIYRKLNIHDNVYNYIKNAYIKQGLQEERKIIEEQNRKRLTESFLPYNAYTVLGILPTVTKAQLKKVYRTLAKKYHPDKFYGQSEEIIEKAEDKFQEILEAYEIIKKYIKKNSIIKN